MPREDSTSRCLEILILLTLDWHTRKWLAIKFNVVPKTIYRDISALKKAGVRIISIRKGTRIKLFRVSTKWWEENIQLIRQGKYSKSNNLKKIIKTTKPTLI